MVWIKSMVKTNNQDNDTQHQEVSTCLVRHTVDTPVETANFVGCATVRGRKVTPPCPSHACVPVVF